MSDRKQITVSATLRDGRIVLAACGDEGLVGECFGVAWRLGKVSHKVSGGVCKLGRDPGTGKQRTRKNPDVVYRLAAPVEAVSASPYEDCRRLEREVEKAQGRARDLVANTQGACSSDAPEAAQQALAMLRAMAGYKVPALSQDW